MKENDIKVTGIGKIHDLFNGNGLTESIKIKSNDDGMNITMEMASKNERSLIFTNLIDFDTLYGHRNDSDGFIRALERFDEQLGKLILKMNDRQLLILTADHGCDPLFKGYDHTREKVPLLAYSPRFKACGELGNRDSFTKICVLSQYS